MSVRITLPKCAIWIASPIKVHLKYISEYDKDKFVRIRQLQITAYKISVPRTSISVQSLEVQMNLMISENSVNCFDYALSDFKTIYFFLSMYISLTLMDWKVEVKFLAHCYILPHKYTCIRDMPARVSIV